MSQNNKKKIPYLSLGNVLSENRNEYINIFKNVLDSGWFIMGKELELFEKEFAAFSQTKYSVGVACGLDAITLSLRVLGVSKGDEVIVPSNTYIATFLAVTQVGAIPVPVEPKIDTCNIDPAKIEEAITKKTKAIIPVHLYGQVCKMDEIMRIAKNNKIFVIEDNAQSHGSFYKNKISGSFGIINATSFYPGKNLGALGDGGAITTNSKKFQEKIRLLRNYGSKTKYINNEIGYNSRLDELQAAFLRFRLKKYPSDLKKRMIRVKQYLKSLEGVGDVILPVTEKKSTHVYHVFQIRTKKRDKLQEYLNKKGTGTLIHYPIPTHLQKAYSFLGYKKGDFPIAEELAKTSLSLPLSHIISEDEVEYITSHIRSFFHS